MLVKYAIVFRCYSALQTFSVKNFSWVYYWQVNVLHCREVSNILLSCYSFMQVLKFNLTDSGLLCVLPWLTMALSANIGGWIADTLVSKGLSVTTVRKV